MVNELYSYSIKKKEKLQQAALSRAIWFSDVPPECDVCWNIVDKVLEIEGFGRACFNQFDPDICFETLLEKFIEEHPKIKKIKLKCICYGENPTHEKRIEVAKKNSNLD